MRSFATQEQESQEDEWFNQATTKTPEAIKKHSSKAPPPLPTTVAELLQLLWRMIVLTTGLFTTHCSLAIQLKDLHTAIQVREQTIMSDPTSMADLIPQLTWIITSTARDFYGTICTKDDIDPAPDGAPRLAIAQLSLHTTMFKAGWKLNIANVPEQWQRQQHKTGGPPQRNKGDGTGGKQGGADKRYGNDPFQQGEGNKAQGKNPKQPSVFANSELLRKVKEKLSGVTLSDIACEAGIRGGPKSIDIPGVASGTCLNWLVMGQCMLLKCKNNHPASLDDTAAMALYSALEPGMKRLIETGKRPRFRQGSVE